MCKAQMSMESDSLLCHRRSGVTCLCDLSPCLAGHKNNAAAPLTLPAHLVKQRHMKGRLRRRNQGTLQVLYPSQCAL